MQRVFLVSGKRTPIGRMLGGLSTVKATQLGSIATQATIEAAGIKPSDVEEVILGNVVSSGLGQNPARQVSLGAGIPKSVPTTLINKVCASGMKATIFGAQGIQLGQRNVVLTGGFESMSQAPYLLPNYRAGNKFGNTTVLDALAYDALTDAYQNCAMGVCAEKTADDFGITREVQDAFAITSYEKAIKATEEGRFSHEIVHVPLKRGDPVVQDEEPMGFRRDKISQLRPVFAKNGTVTAANASKLNDGACSLLLMSEEAVAKYGVKPLAEIISYGDAEVDPMDFNISPAEAAKVALKRANLKISDIDCFEFNEAFSVTGLACMKLLDLNADKVNVNGGAVALGHPVGMSGARIILSLATVLRQTGGKYGLAGICNGGGGSSSVIIRAMQ